MDNKYGIFMGKHLEDCSKEELMEMIVQIGGYYENRIKGLTEELIVNKWKSYF